MIGKFWDKLFEYADSVKKDGALTEGEAVMNILAECGDVDSPDQALKKEKRIAGIVQHIKAEAKLEAVRHIEQILQEAWDDQETFAKRININREPKSELEAMILTIPGLTVWKDPQDKQIYYEMDGRHFDTPKEVIDELIHRRESNRRKAANTARRDTLEFLQFQISRMGELMERVDDGKPKRVKEKARPRVKG